MDERMGVETTYDVVGHGVGHEFKRYSVCSTKENKGKAAKAQQSLCPGSLLHLPQTSLTRLLTF